MKSTALITKIAFATGVISSLFKTMHWPGANILVMITLLLLMLSAVGAMQANKANGITDWINYALTGMLLIFIIGTGFVFFNYPGAGILLTLGHVSLVLMPAIILFFNNNNNVSNEFWSAYLICVMLILMNMPRVTPQTTEPQAATEQTEAAIDVVQ